jgi:hypothetical protein
VVEQLTRDPKLKGLIPVTSCEKVAKIFTCLLAGCNSAMAEKSNDDPLF